MAFRKPAWGIALYLLTFYLSPQLWWWGEPISAISNRINIVTATLLAGIVYLNTDGRQPLSQHSRKVLFFLALYSVNATLVHFVLADNVPRSWNGMTMIWKQLGLLFLIIYAIRSKEDIDILIGSILAGSTYIGFEVVFNERGGISAGRLEGIGAPGAEEANYLAALMCFAVPLGGYWLFFGSRVKKFFSVAALYLIVETIIRCNSRGAFLALIVAGTWLLIVAKGRVRKYAFRGIMLASAAGFMMVGDEEIIGRFMTTFASEEQRDKSAMSRLDYWWAATKMIAENPLGSGAEAAFKSDLGFRYLHKATGAEKFRAVHNGYLDIAASWGIQGVLLFLWTIFSSLRLLGVRRVWAAKEGDDRAAFLGASLEAVLVTQAITCLFISSLDGEWFFWWFAFGLCYAQFFVAEHATEDDESLIE